MIFMAHRRKPDADAFIARARTIAGAANVITDEAHRRLCSIDFSEVPLSTAIAVVRPGSTREVSALVEAARESDVVLSARGGGMSYTLGYCPRDEGTALLDMTRMKAIVIRAEDRLIEVETGARWAEVHAALQPTGLRIGCMGTMSGAIATIGGGLGNNALGHGRGDITDDLLGVEVVLGDGRILQTGALATNPSHPVLRSYGPDFSGVFTHDAGAFGIKTRAVFRLHPRPVGAAYVCYGFRRSGDLVRALCETERLGVMSSNMAFSAYHHRLFAEQRPGREERVAVARQIAANEPSRIRGAMRLLALARPGGFRYLLDWPFSTFGVIDAFDQQTADRMAVAAGRIMRRCGGVKLPDSLGIVFRAQPYMPIERLMLGIDGECTIPTNCGVALSQAGRLLETVESFFAENSATMAEKGVTWTRLFLTNKGGFGIEPIIYWRDRPNALRMAQLSPERRAAFQAMPENLQTRQFAIDLRRRLVERVDRFHPYHFQIGKYYDYKSALTTQAEWDILTAIKSFVDPYHLMNPGGLGLD